MADEQLGFGFGDDRPAADRPLFDPDEIRADALALLEQARRCTREGPWDADELKYRRIMFPAPGQLDSRRGGARAAVLRFQTRAGAHRAAARRLKNDPPW
ncbi:hypothetical protein [uncultured Sphingomonas sp.]|uniref:hypothetical protein n=1 Tax=uncultured Sphingomonas sp. TaxID=158754 RepID=UPI0035CA87F5